jgi:hypothetical protein
VKALYELRHTQAPSSIDLCSTGGLERMARTSLNLLRSWSASSDRPHVATLAIHFTFDLPFGAFAEVLDSRGTWTLIPGGKQILHVYCGPLPTLHVRLIETEATDSQTRDKLSLTLAQSKNGGGWFGDISVRPNRRGTGVYIAYLYAEQEQDEWVPAIDFQLF